MRVLSLGLLLLVLGCSTATAATPPLRPFATVAEHPHADGWQVAWLDVRGRLVVHDTRRESRRTVPAPACPTERIDLEALDSGIAAFKCDDGTLRLVSTADGRLVKAAGVERLNAEVLACRCALFFHHLGRHWMKVSVDTRERHVNWRTGEVKPAAATTTLWDDHDDPRLHARTCRGLPRMFEGAGPDPHLGSWSEQAGWVVRENGEAELGRCGSSRIVKELPGCLVEAHARPHAIGCHRLHFPTPGTVGFLGVLDVYSLPRLRKTTWDFRKPGLGGPAGVTPRWVFVIRGGGPYELLRARIPR